MTPLPRLSRKTMTAAAATALLIVSAACQKDLVRWPNFLKTTFNVRFDWSEVSYAEPSVMQLVVFPDDGRRSLDFGFTRKTGGTADLDAGDYHAVCFNSDTEVLTTRGEGWKAFEVTSQETDLRLFSPMFGVTRNVPRGEGSEDEPVLQEPDMLWTAGDGEVARAGDNASEILTMKMRPSVYTYHFTVSGVSNLEYVTEITATISGMSGSMFPSTGKASDTHCTIPIHVTSDGKSSITCTVRSFGHCPELDDAAGISAGANHHLVVYARLTDSSKWYYDFDVTNELHEPGHTVVTPEGDTEILIDLEELPFPRPIADDSGMHPDVEEWNEVNIDINL